jgi:hypothetical protein
MTHDGFHTAPHGRRTVASLVVVVGVLTGACVSSTQDKSSSTPPSSPVHVTPSSSPVHVTTTEHVHFAGFPSRGAHASKPATGSLVLSFQEIGFRPFGEVDLRVYADGRMLWQNWTPSYQAVVVPPGMKQSDIGFVERRLRPQGIELLRSLIVSTGLFDRNLQLSQENQLDDSDRVLTIIVLNGGRLVSVDTRSLDMTGPKTPEETPAQARTLAQLKAILADPAAWLPPTAWADRQIRAFVPSRYFVNYDRSAPDVSRLPTPLLEVLPQYQGLFGKKGCQELTTDEARVLLDALVAAGKSPSQNGASYIGFDLAGFNGTPSALNISPELPDDIGGSC